MIKSLARNQNWAKAAPVLAVIATVLLFIFFSPRTAMFWALVNIPLYLFHQTEEHLWPGGFKNYMNRVVYAQPLGAETLTDEKVFWINILLVWVAFALFGALAFVNLGFGLVIIIFSILNCVTHIGEFLRRRRWNPGLVMATIQFFLSIYGAWFVTTHALVARHATAASLLGPIVWWAAAIVFSAGVHALLFTVVMGRGGTKQGPAAA